jgi:hypothetical protein
MTTSGTKWARHVHLKSGALAGWCEKCPVTKRHSALRQVARKDGYAVLIRRLNFLRNVASRKTNAKLERVAAVDLRWAQKHLRSSAG